MGTIGELRIPVLTKQNFVIWKKRVLCYLDSLEYLIVVQGEMNGDLTPGQQSAWRKIDKRAKHVISSLVPDNFYSIIDEKETSRGMLDALTEHFMATSVSKQIHIKREIMHLRLFADENMSSFFERFDVLVRDLEAAGATVKEEDKLSYLFLALPSNFDSVTTSLENKDNLTLSEAKRRILAEETKQNGRDFRMNEGESSSAFRGKRRSEVTCYSCGEQGHKSYKCPKLRNNQASANFAFGNGVAMVANAEENFETNDCVAMENNNVTDMTVEHEKIVWVLDSGASHHFCNDLKNLKEVEALENSCEINMANGKRVTAERAGKMSGKSNENVPLTISEILFVPELRCNLMSVKKLTSKGITVTYFEKFALLKKNEMVIGVAKLNGNLYELIVNVKKNEDKTEKFLVHEASGGEIQPVVHEEKLLIAGFRNIKRKNKKLFICSVVEPPGNRVGNGVVKSNESSGFRRYYNKGLKSKGDHRIFHKDTGQQTFSGFQSINGFIA